MSSLQASSAPQASASNAYDKEIVDMADYVHNYEVKSDLAVSRDLEKLFEHLLTSMASSTPLDTCFLIPSAAVSRP